MTASVTVFAEVVLGGLLHLHEHARGDFRRRHLLALGFDPGVAVVGLDDLVGHHVDVLLHDVVVELAADEALDREQGVLRIGHRLALGRLADQDFVVLGERDDGRRGAITLAVLDDARLAAFHDGDAGIGGSQIDADDLAHSETPENSLILAYCERRCAAFMRTGASLSRRERPRASHLHLSQLS